MTNRNKMILQMQLNNQVFDQKENSRKLEYKRLQIRNELNESFIHFKITKDVPHKKYFSMKQMPKHVSNMRVQKPNQELIEQIESSSPYLQSYNDGLSSGGSYRAIQAQQ